jgi:tyrosyl-tRNA synthetase
VKTRLESDTGISFTEFTYQLLQAYDFLHLHRTQGCNIQLGGSDQWGNILAGIDLVHRLRKGEEEVYGMTMPLLVADNGEKFGKSAGNAIWLDEERTSTFDFYQVGTVPLSNWNTLTSGYSSFSERRMLRSNRI